MRPARVVYWLVSALESLLPGAIGESVAGDD